MGIVISVSNNKGGVGKTTTALNVAGGLNKLGKKVLLIDLDTQANLSSCFGVKNHETLHVGSFILKEVEFKELLVSKNGIDLIPSSSALLESEERLATKTRREDFLKNRIATIKNDYDFVIIDCPPNLGLLTTNAIFASDYYITPIEAGTFSYQGVGKLIQKMNELNEAGAGIKLLGVLVIKYHENRRDTLKKALVEAVKDSLGSSVFETYIRTDSNLDKAQLKKMNIFEFSENSNAAIDYLNLVNEILKKI